MIDDEDGDMALMGSMGAGPFVSLILIALAIYCYVEAEKNKDICAEKACTPELVGKLVEHECMCVGKSL